MPAPQLKYMDMSLSDRPNLFAVNKELHEIEAALEAGVRPRWKLHTAAGLRCERLIRLVPEKLEFYSGGWKRHSKLAYADCQNRITANNYAAARLVDESSSAVEILEDAVERYGPTVMLLCNLADGMARSGRAAEGITIMEKASAMSERSVDNHLRLAHAFAVCGLDRPCEEHALEFARLQDLDLDEFASSKHTTAPIRAALQRRLRGRAAEHALDDLMADSELLREFEGVSSSEVPPDGWASRLAGSLQEY